MIGDCATELKDAPAPPGHPPRPSGSKRTIRSTRLAWRPRPPPVWKIGPAPSPASSPACERAGGLDGAAQRLGPGWAAGSHEYLRPAEVGARYFPHTCGEGLHE